MIRLRSLLPFVLALVPVATGCKKDEPPAPAPEGSQAVATTASVKNKLPLRGPLAPIPKFDPQAMKEYRLEVCYFGTLTLRQARDAYLASLGKDEPSETKIPSFGAAGAPLPTLAARATPPGSAAASAGPAAGPSAAVRPVGGRKMAELGLRAPHERNARACTVAAGLKEPAMPEVDAALTAFAPFALELSRNIAMASVYYQREEYTKDKFEKGKELHKKLVDEFSKVDELADKLGAAISSWRKEHPADPAKLDEGEKVVVSAYEKARVVVLPLSAKKIDAAAYKESVAALEKEVEAVKTFGGAHADDPWAKITTPAFEAFLRAAKEAEGKIGDKGLEPAAFLSMVNTFTALVEAKHRALSRSLTAKGQVVEPRVGGGRIHRPGPGQRIERHGDDH